MNYSLCFLFDFQSWKCERNFSFLKYFREIPYLYKGKKKPADSLLEKLQDANSVTLQTHSVLVVISLFQDALDTFLIRIKNVSKTSQKSVFVYPMLFQNTLQIYKRTLYFPCKCNLNLCSVNLLRGWQQVVYLYSGLQVVYLFCREFLHISNFGNQTENNLN